MTTSPATAGRLRILWHAQHLTGVGNAVLPRVLADEAALAHDVVLVEGGPAVPRPTGGAAPVLLPIPVVQRDADGELVGPRGEPGASVLAERRVQLCAAARELQPDVVVIDHYPFSKWHLGDEVAALVDEARSVNSEVRIVASLRDVSPRTRHEAVDDDTWGARVTALLAQQFDVLLIHSDPELARLEDFFPATASMPVPVTYTGYVVEPVPATARPVEEPYAVLSTGGIDSPSFLAAAIDAFRKLAASEAAVPATLHLFAAFDASAEELAELTELAASAHEPRVEVHEFSGDFTVWLQHAALSVSRGGYNTSAALLRARVPAVVVPARGIPDQSMRGELLADRGLAVAVDPASDTDVDVLHHAMVAALESPRPAHELDLDGARATRRFLEGLA